MGHADWLAVIISDRIMAIPVRKMVITIHCPLTPATAGIINEKSISKMKDGVIIVNLSRGPVVNEIELADALRKGKVAAFGADVISEEPMKADKKR